MITFYFFSTLISIHMIFLGAIYGRLDGGGITKVYEWLERTLIMFFFVIACAPFAGFWAMFSYTGVAGIATGHGQYFLNRMIRAVEPETLDFIVRLFFGTDPRSQDKYAEYFTVHIDGHPPEIVNQIRSDSIKYGMIKLYWRNVFGMFVTGSFLGLPAVILMSIFGAWIPAALFGLTGVAKAFAYMAGYAINGQTEPAEYINGALRNVICLAVLAVAFYNVDILNIMTNLVP